MSGWKQRGPRAVTAVELVRTLHIDDSSMRTIADCMKKHSENHGMWIAFKREITKRKFALTRELEVREAEIVSRYAKTASSQAAVNNYAKYDLVLHPDIKRLKEQLDECRELDVFIGDVDRLFSKRAEILGKLLTIDNDAIVADRKSSFDLNAELRETIKSFNSIAERLGMPWRTENV